jgi:hypothetical protein
MLALACGPVVGVGGDATTSGGTSTGGGAAATTSGGGTIATSADAVTTSEPDPTLPVDETGSSSTEVDPSAGFIVDPDGGGPSIECDQWAQDCPPGEKCMPWANDGGSSWNATRCFPW